MLTELVCHDDQTSSDSFIELCLDNLNAQSTATTFMVIWSIHEPMQLDQTKSSLNEHDKLTKWAVFLIKKLIWLIQNYINSHIIMLACQSEVGHLLENIHVVKPGSFKQAFIKSLKRGSSWLL